MKTRIIAMLLLIVMLVTALASCGYSYMKEDYSKYVTFDKEKLDDLLKNVEIEDGAFTADEETRQMRVLDSIYKTLAGKVDADDKITEGYAEAYDIVYYCYYATVENDAKETVVIFASKMQESSATKYQVSLSENKGVSAEIDKAIAEFDFTDVAYKTLTTGKAEEGKVAYITYTVEYKETVDGTEKNKKVTNTYEKVVIGDDEHPVADRLVDYDIATTYKETVDGTEKTSFEVDGKTYSAIKINWVVESGEEITFTNTTYTEKTNEKDVSGTTHDLKDKEITYHVFPVYYLSVKDYNAAEVLKTIITSLTVDSLPSFEGKEESIKTLNELKTKLSDAQKKTSDAETDVEKAEEALEKAENAVGEGKEPTEAQQITIDAARESLAENKETLEAAEKAESEAEAALDAGISKFYETVSAGVIETEYKNSVYDQLLASYNTEIKNNIAKAIWDKMNELSKVSHPSNEAIKPVYDRLMEKHEYDFYTGTYDSTKKISNYKQFGSFDKYLKYKMGVGDADVIKAKDKVWAEAEEYVSEIFIVFAVAEAYDLKLTDADMKEYREDENSSYSYYEYYYGEANVQAAVQFDKLMNHLVEWNTTGEGEDEEVKYVDGKIDFIRVNYSLK